LLLRVAQATTTHTAVNSDFRGCGPACRLRARDGGLVPGPGSHRRSRAPCLRSRSPAPAASARPRRSLRGHHVPSSGQAWIWLAGPAILTKDSSARVVPAGGLPYAH